MKDKQISILETIRSRDLDEGTMRRAIKAARRIAKTGEAHYTPCAVIGGFARWEDTEEGYRFWNDIDNAPMKE